VRVQPKQQKQQEQQEPQVVDEGFQRATRHTLRRTMPREEGHDTEPTSNNTFQSLMDQEQLQFEHEIARRGRVSSPNG